MRYSDQMFSSIGGLFITKPQLFLKKLPSINGILFDWDGVFNSGVKSANNPSTYSEIDSMGINLLRFSIWLETNKIPFVGIITGQVNESAFELAKREHYNAVYSNFRAKKEALDHITSNFKVRPSKMVFMFDDVLDISTAKSSGLAVMVKRSSTPLFTEFVKENNYADYITAHTSSENAIREVCEMLIGMNGNYERVLNERIAYSECYQNYLNDLSKIQSSFFHKTDRKIIESKI